MYHSAVPLSRRGKAAIALALTVLLGALALPYLDALGLIIRATDLPGGPATVAGWRATTVTREAVFTIATRAGDVPARFYRPASGVRRTVLLMPGVHRDGINESRLVSLADDLAATGFGVLTIAAPDLQKFTITPQVTDVIEDAVLWASAQPQ